MNKQIKLKWVVIIAFVTLLVGALLGSFVHWPDSPPIKIIGEDLEFIGEKDGAYQYKITAYHAENITPNISFSAYNSEGKLINCRFTKVNNSSENTYICGSDEYWKNQNVSN